MPPRPPRLTGENIGQELSRLNDAKANDALSVVSLIGKAGMVA